MFLFVFLLFFSAGFYTYLHFATMLRYVTAFISFSRNDVCVCFLFIYFVHSKWDSLPKSFFNIWQSENERWGIVATLCDRKIWDGSHGAAGRAACWQVADEHTGPGTGRAGTGGAEGQREMLASLVKNVVGFKVRRANVSISSSHSITAERGVKTNIYIYDCFVFFKNDRLNNNVLSPYIVLLR